MLETPRVEEGGHIGPVNSALVPRYSGESTYALLARLRDIETQDRQAGIKIVGVPFDSGVSYRPGARLPQPRASVFPFIASVQSGNRHGAIRSDPSGGRRRYGGESLQYQ